LYSKSYGGFESKARLTFCGTIQPMNTQSNHKQTRLRLSLLALAVLILTPFGLYFALQAGADWLAAFLFALLSGAILLVMFAA